MYIRCVRSYSARNRDTSLISKCSSPAIVVSPYSDNSRTVQQLTQFSSAQFAARLTIPTVPSKTYTTSTDYHSKAAAREAVAALSIAEGLVDHLKAHASPSNPRVSSKNGGIAHPSASTSQPPPSDMMMDIPAPIVPIMGNLPHEKASYTEQLRCERHPPPTTVHNLA